MYQDMAARQFDSISEVLETYYAQKNASSRIRQKSADLRHLVNTMLERESKKLDLQERQLKDTGKRDKFRLYGELLNTWGYNVPSGASSVTLPNYYDNDTEVKITLDPNKTASENAQRYYEKYEKLKRTFEALNELTEQTRSEVEQLKSIQTFLDQAQSEADLNQIREELVTSGYLKKHDTQKKKGVSRPERSRPWHYRTQDGYDIYVGKNNLQNDELTFKSANASDWWFHSKKAPGSHVIARRKDGQDLPDHVFELAASAAAYYSSARDADKVEIDYVQRREVKKPNGSKPGFVIYYTNYSMTARPDISQLTLVE
jgi:predicted ribosome quality control (RQC) complex YloA/Tae2 family protein